MRIIGEEVRHEMVISDAVSGAEITFFYRIPTTTERMDYFSNLYKREGEDLIDQSSETRLRWAKEVITGVGEDCFGFQPKKKKKADPEAEIVPLTSDKNSEHYRKDWLDLIIQLAPDLCEFLVVRVFDGAKQMPPLRGKEKYTSKN
jgi:hypothetical protein